MGDHGKGSLSLPPLNVHAGGGGRATFEPMEVQPQNNNSRHHQGPKGLTLPIVSVNVRQPDADHPTAPMGPSSSTSTNMVAPPANGADPSSAGKRFNRPLRIEVTPPPQDTGVIHASNNGPGSINITINSTTGGGNQPIRRPIGSDHLAPIDTNTTTPQPTGSAMRRVSSTPGGLYSTSLAKRERPKVSRGVLRVDVPPEVSAKIHEILGDTCDMGELLHNTICNVDPMLNRTMRRSTTSSFTLDSPIHSATPMSPSLIDCWDTIFNSRPYQKVVAIKDSLARVYVLTIAKHLVSSLLKVKQNQDYLKQLRRNEHDIKQLAGLLNKHMESLTVFTSASPGTKEVLNDQDRGFLGSMPVPAYVCWLVSQLPFLSHCLVQLSRATLSFLAACDNVVRETLLENATSGRYFFSQSLLRKDLEGAVSYFQTQEVYLDYYGHLSTMALVEGCLPYTPLSKLELYSLISVGTSRYKATSAVTGSVSPSFASLGADSDHDMLDVMVEVLFADDPFRCSPFMVTFGRRDSDPRPAYTSMTIASSTTTTTASTFPQIYLSLSRQLYYCRMTKEGLDDFLKRHFELSGDYLTWADLPSLIDMAMGLVSTGVDTVFIGKRLFGEYTTNVYADMVVAKFISNFYHDCLRKMQTQPTDGGPLAFSQQFSMTNRPSNMLELEHVLQLSTTGDSIASLGDTQPPMGVLGATGGETLRHTLGATLQFSEGKDQMYILAVTERLMGGLKLAQHAMDRSRISSCEMVQAMLVWYIVWAQGSISRCVSAGKNMDTVKRRSTFESLRRICALCADLNCVARFCDEVIERIRPEEMFASQNRTPSSRAGNSSSQVFFGSMSLCMSFHGGSTTTPRRGLNQSTPTGMSKRAVTPTSTRRSHTPRNASMILGPKRTHNESFAGGAPQQSDITDITGYDVIVLHLSSIADDLKLLSAQCLEQAIELGTRIAGHICKEHITKKHGDKTRPFFPGGRRTSQKAGSPISKKCEVPPSPDHMDTSMRPSAPAAAGEDRRVQNGGGGVEFELPSSPRPWATEMEQQLFKPLSDFCRSDMFSSETILPRILESCLHEALERVGSEYQYKVTVADARALHTDFMYLKIWMEKEQKNQFPKCNLTELRVFDRLHVTLSILELPPDITSWSKVDLASLYLVPDAPRWVKTRADRGKVPFSTVRRTNNREEAAPVMAPPSMRMSLNIHNQSLDDIVRLLSTEEAQDASVRLSTSGRPPSA